MNDQDKLIRLRELFLRLSKVEMAEEVAEEVVEDTPVAEEEMPLAEIVSREEFDALVEIVKQLVETVMPKEEVVEEEVVEEVEAAAVEEVVEEEEEVILESFKHKPATATKKMGEMPKGQMSTQQRVNAMLFA